jgi:hypothetical protein
VLAWHARVGHGPHGRAGWVWGWAEEEEDAAGASAADLLRPGMLRAVLLRALRCASAHGKQRRYCCTRERVRTDQPKPRFLVQGSTRPASHGAGLVVVDSPLYRRCSVARWACRLLAQLEAHKVTT